MSPLVVELIGKPGSGKSTAAFELIELLSEAGIDVAHNDEGSRPPEALLVNSRLMRNLKRVGHISSRPLLAMSLAVRSTSRLLASEMWRLATRELRMKQLMQLNHAVVVVDEGAIHKLCIMYAEGEARQALGVLKRLTLPNLCFDLRLDAQTAMQRIRGRTTTSPVDLKSDADLLAYLRRYQECEDLILELSPGAIIPLDAAGPDVAGVMAKAVREALSES